MIKMTRKNDYEIESVFVSKPVAKFINCTFVFVLCSRSKKIHEWHLQGYEQAFYDSIFVILI